MSDLFLLAAGIVFFALTTMSTLWFGYRRFFEWYALAEEQSRQASTVTT